MIKAIVYKSHTGFTEKYALMLSEAVGVEAYDIKEASSKLTKGDEIVYMGWIMASRISGLSKARKKYNIKAICAVGMSFEDKNTIINLKKANRLESLNVFYLQGGINKNKLKGVFKIIVNMAAKSLENKENKNETDILTISIIRNGEDMTHPENLKETVKFILS